MVRIVEIAGSYLLYDNENSYENDANWSYLQYDSCHTSDFMQNIHICFTIYDRM